MSGQNARPRMPLKLPVTRPSRIEIAPAARADLRFPAPSLRGCVAAVTGRASGCAATPAQAYNHKGQGFGRKCLYDLLRAIFRRVLPFSLVTPPPRPPPPQKQR